MVPVLSRGVCPTLYSGFRNNRLCALRKSRQNINYQCYNPSYGADRLSDVSRQLPDIYVNRTSLIWSHDPSNGPFWARQIQSPKSYHNSTSLSSDNDKIRVIFNNINAWRKVTIKRKYSELIPLQLSWKMTFVLVLTWLQQFLKFSLVPRPAVGPTHAFTQWVKGFFSGGKAAREWGCLRSEVKSVWSHTSTPCIRLHAPKLLRHSPPLLRGVC
jgi:hypothetical protein